jgi:hypothetical protein
VLSRSKCHVTLLETRLEEFRTTLFVETITFHHTKSELQFRVYLLLYFRQVFFLKKKKCFDVTLGEIFLVFELFTSVFVL